MKKKEKTPEKKIPMFDMINIPVTNEELIRVTLDRFEKEGKDIINVFSLNGRSFTFFTRKL